MKQLTLLLMLVLAFVSCDGRNRAHKSHIEVLKESRLFETFSEQFIQIPEKPINITTDTILSTGLRVKISYSSVDNDLIVKTIKNTATKHYYRNFKATYLVLKDNTTIKIGSIDKNLFYNYASPSFWEKAVMQYVWVDYSHTKTNSVKLNTCFVIPTTTIVKDFSLIINQNGTTQIVESNPIKTL